MRFSALPPFLAWQAFGDKNGTKTYAEFCQRLEKYRGRNSINGAYQVGCSILTEPFWFNENDWIPVPEWSISIVSGKRFFTDTDVGAKLYQDVMDQIPRSKHVEAAGNSILKSHQLPIVMLSIQQGTGWAREPSGSWLQMHISSAAQSRAKRHCLCWKRPIFVPMDRKALTALRMGCC